MLTFEIEEIAGREPCPPGIEAARALFEPGRRYTLAEVRAAGLSHEGVAWLLINAATRDRGAFSALCRWAEACGAKPGPTVKLCMANIMTARVARVAALKAQGIPRDEAKVSVLAADHEAMIKAFS